MARQTGDELIKKLPPKIRRAFIVEVKKQNSEGYLYGKKFDSIADMVNTCLTWDSTTQGSEFWVKLYDKTHS